MTGLALLLSACAALAAPAPRLAIVIDDFGLDYKTTPPDARWLALPFPVTIAVMPESPRTRASAKLTKESPHELIIHFPFDPFLSLELPAGEASPGDLAKVEALLEKSFGQIPGPKGLNNHRSLEATKNRPLMAAFMKRLKAKGVYFLDSRVSAASVARDEARKAGIPAAANTVFLEAPRHYNDKAFCLRMLRQAAREARRSGRAVAIGHHYYRGTYDCVAEEAPKLAAEGFELVYASALAD